MFPSAFLMMVLGIPVVVSIAARVFRCARIQLLFVYDALSKQKRLQGGEPSLVIVRCRCCGVVGGNALDQSVAEATPWVYRLLVQGDGDPEGPTLPGSLEDQLPVAAGQSRVS